MTPLTYASAFGELIITGDAGVVAALGREPELHVILEGSDIEEGARLGVVLAVEAHVHPGLDGILEHIERDEMQLGAFGRGLPHVGL